MCGGIPLGGRNDLWEFNPGKGFFMKVHIGAAHGSWFDQGTGTALDWFGLAGPLNDIWEFSPESYGTLTFDTPQNRPLARGTHS